MLQISGKAKEESIIVIERNPPYEDYPDNCVKQTLKEYKSYKLLSITWGQFVDKDPVTFVFEKPKE